MQLAAPQMRPNASSLISLAMSTNQRRGGGGGLKEPVAGASLAAACLCFLGR